MTPAQPGDAAALRAVPLQAFGGQLVDLVPVVLVVGTLLGYVLYRLVYATERAVAGATRAVGATLANSVIFAAVPTDRGVTTRYRPRNEVLYVLLALVNASMIVGTVLAARTGRPRFFGMTLVGIAMVGLLDALVFRPFDRVGASTLSRASAFWIVVQDRRFAATALIVSLAVLITLGRGILYFLLVAVFVTSLVVHVYLADERDVPIVSSLAALAFGSGLLLAAQTLTVPYYVQTLDTVYHTAIARRIANVGAITPVLGTRYADLPIFHTLAAVCIQLSPFAPRTTVAVLFALLFPVVVVACYAIVRNVAGSAKVGFFAAALLAANPEFIRWGTQSHVQSLSFVFLAVFVLLLSKWAPDVRYTIAAGVVALAWTMTHHLSVFMSLVLIFVWTVVGAVWVLAANRADRDAVRRPLYQFTILAVFVAVYWWLTDLFQVPIRWLTRTSTKATSGLPTEHFLIKTYTDPVELAVAAVPFLLNNLHYAFFVALGGYGLWTIARPDGEMPSRAYPKVIVGFLVAVMLYVPNPTWMVGRGVAALNRWGIMTVLFLLPVVALGLARISTSPRRSAGTVSVALLVLATAFLSIGGGFTDPSLADASGYEKGARKHLTDGDLDAADHVLRHTSDTPVHASHVYAGYLIHEEWSGPTGDRSERFHRMQVVDGDLVTEPGLTVVERTSLRKRRVKVGVTPERSDRYEGSVSILTSVSSEDVRVGAGRESVVYDNGDTFVIYQDDSAGSETGPGESDD